MKKSNVIIIAALLVISAILLALWFILGFNNVDAPLDLALSIAWWIMTAIAIAVIVRMENIRQRKMRTAFLAEGALFNPEAGVVGYNGSSAVPVLANVLDSLNYDMETKDMPKMGYKYIVRTDSYSKSDSGKSVWNGEIQLANSVSNPRRFNTRRELERILDQGSVAFA